jgi:diguanylate cyclase (GGDEF)-like protein
MVENASHIPPVLVVDDEPVMRDVMRDILAECGYQVDVETNGETGLARLKKRDYVLIFADIRMPKMDGIEFLRRAKHLKPDLDIIMMTGYGTVDVAVEAMKLGARDFITKPFNLDHIKLVAGRAIERRNLKKQAEEVEYYKKISLTDGLTELYNHRYFHQLLNSEISRSKRNNRRFCLLMIDVDDFKSYNDALGHPTGDEALKFLGWLLRHHARVSDWVCRYGGEEFSIILPEAMLSEGKLAAERFRRIVEETEFNRQEVMPGGNLTVSIGVACYPDDGNTSEIIIENADRAMYQAKREGKNRVVSWSESQVSLPSKEKM